MAQIGPLSMGFPMASFQVGLRRGKKETDRCPGGKHGRCTQIRGVWGKSWVPEYLLPSTGWLAQWMWMLFQSFLMTLSQPAAFQLLVHSLCKENAVCVFFGG